MRGDTIPADARAVAFVRGRDARSTNPDPRRSRWALSLRRPGAARLRRRSSSLRAKSPAPETPIFPFPSYRSTAIKDGQGGGFVDRPWNSVGFHSPSFVCVAPVGPCSRGTDSSRIGWHVNLFQNGPERTAWNRVRGGVAARALFRNHSGPARTHLEEMRDG